MRLELHYILVYDTEKNKWFLVSGSDFFPENTGIWDKEEHEWIGWEDSPEAEEEYNKHFLFVEETIRDFNFFVDSFVDESTEV